MSTSTESCHDLDMAEPESRDNVYSSSSSYSTYSREIKYIFNPADDSIEEYSDYSHINPCSKQNYNSYAPHYHNTSSQVSGKENRTPRSSRNEQVLDPSVSSLRSCNSYLNTSGDRGPITSHIEENTSSHYGYAHSKHAVPTDNISKERTYFSPRSEISSYPYSRHSIQVWKKNNSASTQPHRPNAEKQSIFHQDTRSRSDVLNTFHTNYPLTNTHNYDHYQQPNIRHGMDKETVYQQTPHKHNNQAGHEPSYLVPSRYSHQHHARRKTWSPPTLKMSLLNASSHAARVCYSNDSLDCSDDTGLERKTQSLTEDLDVTPPKLAPISGVLTQMPGPNLVRPIAFKPVQAYPSSLLGQVTQRHHEPDGYISEANETVRPQTLKKNNNLQNGKSNLGAFNSMVKPQYHSPGEVSHVLLSSDSVQENVSHLHSSTLHTQPMRAHNFNNSWQHSSSINTSQNVSTNTYSNVPATSSMSAKSSHLSAVTETSFANEYPRDSEGTESAQPVSVLRVSFHAAESVVQIPSPSDSGVGELEAMLREKDAEINTLREVMDRNERAIFQVYEERKHSWLQDTQEKQNDYECKLKIQSRKAYKTEQVLSLQMYRLQQEQIILQDEKTAVISERDVLKQQAEENQNQISELKLALEIALSGGRNSAINTSLKDDKLIECSPVQDGKQKNSSSLQEELSLKNKELITLKSKLHTFQGDLEKKNRELAEKAKEVSAKSEEVKVLKDKLARLRDPPALVESAAQTHVPSEITSSENIKPSMLGERDRTISSLQEELAEVLAQVDLLKEVHEQERHLWLDEKNRVVRYQKQLQLNYVQIQRKNVALETEVQQLTLELESRDMKLIALTGDESIC